MPDYQITYDLKICSPLQCTWSIGSAPGVNQRDHGWLGNNYEVIAAPAWCNHVLRTKFDEFITDLSIFTDRPNKFSLFFFNVGSTGCPQNHVGWKVLAEMTECCLRNGNFNEPIKVWRLFVNFLQEYCTKPATKQSSHTGRAKSLKETN